MSKAFTREDDAVVEPILARPSTSLPPGVKNYITSDGVRRLRVKLKHLSEVERPRLADQLAEEGSSDTSVAQDIRRQLQLIDQRIAQLDQSLLSAEVVEPPTGTEDVVRFGATVTVRDATGDETEYRIVGVDETDIDRNWVSWRSPIARALINSRLGQTVQFRFPAGEKNLSIVGVSYEPR